MKNKKLAAIAVAAMLTGNLTAAGAGAVRAENQTAGGVSPSVESERSVEEGLQLLKENLERLIAENADLKAKNVSLQADKVQLQNELSELQSSFKSLEKKLKEYEDQEKARAEAEKQKKAAESPTPSLPYPEAKDDKAAAEDKEEDASGTGDSKEDTDQDAREEAGKEEGKAGDSSDDDEAGSRQEKAGETEKNGQMDPAGEESSDREDKKAEPEENGDAGSTSADDPADPGEDKADDKTETSDEAEDDTEAAPGSGDDTKTAKVQEGGDETADTSKDGNKKDGEENGEESAAGNDAGSISWTSVGGEESAADQTAAQTDPKARGSEETAEDSDDSDLVSMEPVSSDAAAQKEDQTKEPVSVQNDPVFERTYIGTDMIVTVQNTLIENGYPCGRIDGVLGQSTASQISAWEEDNGLTPTGAISDALVEGLLGFSLPGSNDVFKSSEVSNVPMEEAMILSIDLSDQGRSEDTYQVGVEVKSTVPTALADASVTLVYYDQYGDKLAEETLRCGHTLPYGQSWKDTSVLRGERESWDVAAVGVSSCTYRLEKPDAYGFTEYSINLQTGLVTGNA